MRTAGVELSKKNKYWMSKHRFLELYHYCLQYKEWQDEYNSLNGRKSINYDGMPHASNTGDQTYELAQRRAALKTKIEEIEETAKETDARFYTYILRAVTDDTVTYNYLHQVMGIPCGKNMYYDLRRKFYYYLDKKLKKK